MLHPDDIEHPVGDYSDDEDPWKPLNTHEPGHLKIRPYMRGTGSCSLWIYIFYLVP
jgi:condensin-2 complex subunit H2